MMPCRNCFYLYISNYSAIHNQHRTCDLYLRHAASIACLIYIAVAQYCANNWFNNHASAYASQMAQPWALLQYLWQTQLVITMPLRRFCWLGDKKGDNPVAMKTCPSAGHATWSALHRGGGEGRGMMVAGRRDGTRDVPHASCWTSSDPWHTSAFHLWWDRMGEQIQSGEIGFSFIMDQRQNVCTLPTVPAAALNAMLKLSPIKYMGYAWGYRLYLNTSSGSFHILSIFSLRWNSFYQHVLLLLYCRKF